MINIHTILIIVAIVLFVLSSLPIPFKLNLFNLGWASLAASLLV